MQFNHEEVRRYGLEPDPDAQEYVIGSGEPESWPARLRVSAARWREEATRAYNGTEGIYGAECEHMAMRAERLAHQLECEEGLR